MKKSFVLNAREKSIMKQLWKSNKPLSSMELLAIPELGLEYPAQLYRIINSLLDKELIRVDGVVISGKKNMRLFTTAVTEEEFLAGVVTSNAQKSQSLANVVVALAENTITSMEESPDELQAFLTRLQTLIDEKK